MEHFGDQTVFIAAVAPLITPDVKESVIQNYTMIFHSAHGLDMKFAELSKKYVQLTCMPPRNVRRRSDTSLCRPCQ